MHNTCRECKEQVVRIHDSFILCGMINEIELRTFDITHMGSIGGDQFKILRPKGGHPAEWCPHLFKVLVELGMREKRQKMPPSQDASEGMLST